MTDSIDIDPSETKWRSMVESVLKGSPFTSLVTTTLDGIEIQPLYRRSADPSARSAVVRNADGDARPDGLWDVRVIVDHPDVARANAVLLSELEQGANSAYVRFAGALRRGDINGPIDGVVVTSAPAMAELLAGVYLEAARVELDAGACAFDAAEWIASAWAEAGVADSDALVDLGIDPVGTMLLTGIASIDAGTVEAARSVVRRHLGAPGVRPLAVDTSVHVDAGATEVQELAAMLGTAAEYARWLCDGDDPVCEVDALTDRMSLAMSLTADQFSTIAKLRAARALWTHFIESCGGAQVGRDISGRTSRYMMAARDPWVNMLRGTTATLAGVVGGAQSIVVVPFDAAIGTSTEFAHRTARNTQLLLQDESGVGRPVDPAGGSPYVEQLTDEFVRLGWELFVEIERQGGMIACCESGWWQAQVEAKRTAREQLVARRKVPITGVSEFPLLDEEAVAVETVDSAAAIGLLATYLTSPDADQRRCEALVPTRQSRVWERLRDRVDRLSAHGERPMATLLCLGTAAEYGARQQWIENLLAAVGIGAEIVAYEPGEAPSSSGAITVLCGTDAAYAESGLTALAGLNTDSPVLVAGRTGFLEGADAPGVTAVFAGADVRAILSDLVDSLDGG